MKLLKFLAFFALFIFSLFPTVVSSVYLFGGKRVMIEFIDGISADRFWLFGISLFIITFGTTVAFMYVMLNVGSRVKPKKVIPLTVDDPDLSDRIRRLNILETQTH